MSRSAHSASPTAGPCATIVPVRPYDDLTESGRTRRLVAAARPILAEHYGVSIVRTRPQRRSFNRLVRVDLADGQSLALRISPTQRIHADEVEAIEHRWLTHLADTSSVTAPRLVPDRHGRVRHRLSVDGLDGPRTLTVFTWLRGRRIPRLTGPDRAHQLGRLAARLHRSAAGLDISDEWQQACRADDPVTFAPCDGLHRYRGSDRNLVHEAHARVCTVVAELWKHPPHPPHLVHGDLGPHNVLVHRNQMRPLDFQDLLWGFTVQDTCISLADMER